MRIPQRSEKLPPLVIIIGPTGVGKTAAAVQLARRMNGEIVSADSSLFYRGMDIGTAKPSLDERQGVRHHLIDVAEPDQPWSLALFQEQAQLAIAGILGRGHLPILVGGTGQYIRAVIQGWQPPQVQPQPGLRRALEEWAEEIGRDGLHSRLALLDPQAAEKIDERNLRRTVRALEVILTSGRPFSQQRQQVSARYDCLILGLALPRPVLYARIDARIEKMLADGFEGEVRRLLELGFSPELPTLSAIGYREMIAFIRGEIALLEAVARMKRRTRIFVRRQANWFKAEDSQIRWFTAQPGAVEAMEEAIREWLQAGCK